jgi:methyl halide transferase
MSGASLKHLDWDAIYREGTPPWEMGVTEPELIRAVESGEIARGTALEIGCGTGADAVYLARRGFELTAVDISPMAIERARVRAERENALARFVQADIFRFAASAGTFDFVYDRGFYHFARRANLDALLDVLWRVTRPGSYYLSLAGSVGETQEGGPPQVSEEEIYDELGRLFEFVEIRQFRFESPQYAPGYLGWSCLMRRPVIGKPTPE